MRKIALAAVAALALPLALPAMAQQNRANENAPGQNLQQNAPAQNMQQSQSSNPASGQQLSQNEIRQAQQALEQKGFKVGKPDGKLGPETKQALSSFQKSQNLQQSGELDQQTLAALGINASETTGQGPTNQPANQPMPRGQGQSQPSQNQGTKSPNGK